MMLIEFWERSMIVLIVMVVIIGVRREQGGPARSWERLVYKVWRGGVVLVVVRVVREVRVVMMMAPTFSPHTSGIASLSLPGTGR